MSKPNDIENGQRNSNLPLVLQLLTTTLVALILFFLGPKGLAEERGALAEAPPIILSQDPPKVVPRVLDRAKMENTRVEISLGRQRAYLLVEDEVAIDTPVSTGKRRGQTPVGQFLIENKRTAQSSPLHGDFVDALGRVVRAPSGTTFKVVPMAYFMQLNHEGLSLQAGRLPGYPAADTAVRLPVDIAPLIYQLVRPGTSVMIEE